MAGTRRPAMQPEQGVPALPTVASLSQVSPIDGAARLCSLRFSVYLHRMLQEDGHLEIFKKNKDIKKKTPGEQISLNRDNVWEEK